MSRKDTVREVLSVIDSVTCLYTELAKSYFLLGPLMAEENRACFNFMDDGNGTVYCVYCGKDIRIAGPCMKQSTLGDWC